MDIRDIEGFCNCHKDVQIRAVEAAEKVALAAIDEGCGYPQSNFISALQVIFKGKKG